MENNEKILERLYSSHKVIQGDVHVSLDELARSGWVGTFPTEMFKKYDMYWIRMIKGIKKYKIIKIEHWMVDSKKERELDANAPLPISGRPKFNLKNMYKDKLKEEKK